MLIAMEQSGGLPPPKRVNLSQMCIAVIVVGMVVCKAPHFAVGATTTPMNGQ